MTHHCCVRKPKDIWSTVRSVRHLPPSRPRFMGRKLKVIVSVFIYSFTYLLVQNAFPEICLRGCPHGCPQRDGDETLLFSAWSSAWSSIGKSSGMTLNLTPRIFDSEKSSTWKCSCSPEPKCHTKKRLSPTYPRLLLLEMFPCCVLMDVPVGVRGAYKQESGESLKCELAPTHPGPLTQKT